MSKGRADGVTRGDLRRNARKARLRAMVPAGNAVAGLDLGEKKQALVVTGVDGLVLARRSPQVTVHGLGAVLDWAAGKARAAGFAGLTVACEPTGSRWMVVAELCAQRGLPMVCVQPLVSHVAREQQDLTGDKTDEGDCVLIARLARELHCYVPEKVEGLWADLREAGRCRAQLITNATAAKQLIRDKLGLAAPALLAAASAPLDSATWLASLEVTLEQCGGDPAAVTAMGYEAFAAQVAARVGGWGGKRAGVTGGKLFAALADRTGVIVPARRAALRRARHGLEDLKYARSRRAQLEAEMTGLLDELGIDHARICEIPGLTPVGLAAILAETGDLRRYESSGSAVKHAGMSPARNESAAFHGKTRVSRRGRPALRLAVWRAAWAVLRHCDVLAAKHAALTSRDGEGKLADGQARVACAASLLRWIYALTVHHTRWDARIAAGELGHHHAMAA
jgi:transposase